MRPAYVKGKLTGTCTHSLWCNQPSISSRDECEQHARCEKCNNLKVPFGTYCLDHKCRSTSHQCLNLAVSGKFCMQHSCQVVDCRREAVPYGNVCDRHNTCKVPGCGEQRAYKLLSYGKVCRFHETVICKKGDCLKKAESAGLCFKHFADHMEEERERWEEDRERWEEDRERWEEERESWEEERESWEEEREEERERWEEERESWGD